MSAEPGDRIDGSSLFPEDDSAVYVEAEEDTTLPGGSFVFDAEFSRTASDLILTGDDGARLVVKGYFDLPEEGRDLWTEDGHLFSHQLVETLAGPLAPGLYAQSGSGPGAEEVGKVAEIGGEVWATRSDGVREDLQLGSSIFQGDVLETGAGGSLEIVFVDGMEFSMAGNTLITVDEMIYNPDDSVGASLLSVVKGSFVFITGWIAGSGPDAMQVKTPAGTIGIRGTRVGCMIDSQSGSTICSLLEGEGGHVGEVAFSNATGTVLLTRLFETVFGAGFNSRLDTETLSEIELRSLLGDIYDELALETEAAPVIKSSGSVFIEPDFENDDSVGLEALVASGVLGEQTTLLPLALPQALSDLEFIILEDEVLQTPAVTVSLDEDGLQTGGSVRGDIGFGIGGDPTDSLQIAGISAEANGNPVVLTSGGDPVAFRIQDDGQTAVGVVEAGVGGIPGEREIFTLTLDPVTGDFVFSLAEALDHFVPNATGADDTIELSFEIDGVIEGLSVTTQIDVAVEDDGPVPVDKLALPAFVLVGAANGADAPAPEDAPDDDAANATDAFGLLIAIDVSTSMNTQMTLANGENMSRLALTKLAAEDLARRFFEVGNETGGDFRVSLVVFANGAATLSPPGAFTDFASFAVAVRGITDANGYPGVNDGTNFFVAVEAIQEVAQNQLPAGPAANTANSIYFISDGFVTTGPPVSESNWEDFLTERGITSVAVAVDPGDDSIDPLLDVNSPDAQDDPLVLTAVDDLSKEVANVILPGYQGNLLLDAQNADLGLNQVDDFGADGFERIVSLVVDGTTYSYDPGNDRITAGQAAPTAGSVLSVETALGGQLEFDFTSGAYRYVGSRYDHPEESFTYRIADRDGDTATAELIVNPNNYTFSLTDHPSGSFTLLGFDQDSDRITITDVVDSDQDGDSDLADLVKLGATVVQDVTTLSVTFSLDADTSIVLDGIHSQVADLQDLNEVANIVITG